MTEYSLDEILGKAILAEGCLDKSERLRSGAKALKIAALGVYAFEDFCCTKTSEEMSKLLCRLGMAKSEEEGKEKAKSLVGRDMPYNLRYRIDVSQIQDDKGRLEYKLTVKKTDNYV